MPAEGSEVRTKGLRAPLAPHPAGQGADGGLWVVGCLQLRFHSQLYSVCSKIFSNRLPVLDDARLRCIRFPIARME